MAAAGKGKKSGVKVTKDVKTTTTTKTRDVTTLVVKPVTTVQEVGSFVKDISINPYIRPQVVAFIARGLKPNSDVYAFFDDVPVSDNCAPGVLSGLTEVEQGMENKFVNQSLAYGSQLRSDASGECIGLFKIPEAVFRTGDRIFMLCDVDDLVTGGDAALMRATARFSASSISVTSQGISLTTITPQISTKVKTDTKVIVDVVVDKDKTKRPDKEEPEGPVISPDHRDSGSTDPIAQSVYISVPTSATGMFIDKVGVFFKAKDDTLGITCHFTEMNYGDPDASRILVSKHLTPSQVSISNDSTAETIFDFEGLAYCASDSYYAFIIEPDGASPNYLIWVSEVGGNDVQSGRQIHSNPYVGTMFISSNRNTWTPIQTEDIKFNLYRAKFTSLSGTATFKNEDDDFFTVNGFTMANSTVAVEAGDIVRTLDANSDILVGNTSPIAYVQSVDQSNNNLRVDSSSGNFAEGVDIEIHRQFMNNQTSLNSNTLIASATIESIDNMLYSAVVPRFAMITPGFTSVSYSFKGINDSYSPDPGFQNVEPETEYEMTDQDRMIASRSNEVVHNANNKSAEFSLSLGSINDFISPIIDLTRKSSLFIENIINNDATDEETRYGNALAKYVSKIIELDEGQDCEDLDLFLTAYRPFGTDVQVFIKAQNGTDNSPFDDLTWSKMRTISGAATYSSTSDSDDFREYRFSIAQTAPDENPTAVYRLTGNDSVAQYTDAGGAVYFGIKRYSIKIVLLAERKSLIPKLKDVRAIATQV